MTRRSRDDTLVYSTDRGTTAHMTPLTPCGQARAARPEAARSSPSDPRDGTVRIWLERKGRNGKPVSIVRGLALAPAELAALGSRLKRTCGTGGSVKDGEIIIQGDHRTRIAAELERQGLRVKLAGG